MRRAPRSAALALATTAMLATGAIAGCTTDSGSTKEFCAQIEKVPALESVLARFSEADRGVLDDRIAKARAAYDDLADAAPPAIAEETGQVVGLVNAILDAVEEHPTDPAKASAQLREAMTDHEGIDADRSKVAAFAQDECDVQLDATLTEGTATSTSTTVAGATTTVAPNSTATTTTGG